MGEETFEKVISAPAIALEKTIDSSGKLHDYIVQKSPIVRAKAFWKNLGPGLTTGASDDDPSGIATYSQTGAQYGFQLLWLAIFTFPLLAFVQEMCVRIGMVTGRGLAANIRIHFPRWVLYLCTFLLFFANTLNLGADIGAMAKGIQLLVDIPFSYLVFGLSIFCLLLQIFSTYEKYAAILKWLAMVLISYIITALFINFDWQQILKSTFVPSITFSKEQIFLICGILGTTISPYLFFWQTSQEVEEQILDGKTTLKLRQAETTAQEIKDMRVDVWSGMFLSNLVMFFIIAVSAATLFRNGITNITSAADAAAALKPFAGEQAALLFTVGIIGTGLLAVPVLAGSTSYAISESMGWKYGLYRKLKEAYAFYGVIILSSLLGLAINFIGLDPIKALIYSAVLNGLIAPLILALIVIISAKEKVMGEWVNSTFVTILGWVVTGLMVIAGLATIVALFF